MTNSCRKIVLLLAFIAMPMQGVAATLAVLFCHGETQLHAVHEHDAHDHGSQHDGNHSGSHDDGGTGSLVHLCCHLSVTAPVILTLPSILPDATVRALAPDTLHDLYFPDQPQRPPLA